MRFLGGISEVSEMKSESDSSFSKESLDKYDKILGDNELGKVSDKEEEVVPKLDTVERENKFTSLFNQGGFFKKTEFININNINGGQQNSNEVAYMLYQDSDNLEKREPNSEYELDGDIYETDDNGNMYKKNGELLPNTEYTINGNTYRTDEYGNKVSCDSEPKYTDEGTRNIKEQKEVGGEERQDDDDGGHIIAKILGGAEGDENLVPMRRTINRGDYKKMENEIAKALQDGKKVTVHIDLEYDGESQRPSKIRAEYTIGRKKTVVEFDNDENSTELLDSLEQKISDEDYYSIKEEIEDMKADGIEAAVTSVKTEYNDNGNPTKITVGVLDESTGKKTYKVYEPR